MFCPVQSCPLSTAERELATHPSAHDRSRFARVQAYADYHDMMELTENLVSGAASHVLGTTTVVGGDEEGSPPDLELKAPWRRVTMNDLVKEKIGRCVVCAA